MGIIVDQNILACKREQPFKHWNKSQTHGIFYLPPLSISQSLTTLFFPFCLYNFFFYSLVFPLSSLFLTLSFSRVYFPCSVTTSLYIIPFSLCFSPLFFSLPQILSLFALPLCYHLFFHFFTRQTENKLKMREADTLLWTAPEVSSAMIRLFLSRPFVFIFVFFLFSLFIHQSVFPGVSRSFPTCAWVLVSPGHAKRL